MEKVIRHLPISKNALWFRIWIIEEKIDHCEQGIPPEFWCNDCKQLLAKIDNLRARIKDIDLTGRTPPGVYTDLGNYLGDGGFSSPTPTFKYVCSSCGYTCVNKEHLWPPMGMLENVDKKLQCSLCGGKIKEIKTQ